MFFRVYYQTVANVMLTHAGPEVWSCVQRGKTTLRVTVCSVKKTNRPVVVSVCAHAGKPFSRISEPEVHFCFKYLWLHTSVSALARTRVAVTCVPTFVDGS